MSDSMTFAEVYRAAMEIADELGHGSVCVQVDGWGFRHEGVDQRHATLEWIIWVKDGGDGLRFTGPTGGAALAAYRAKVSDPAEATGADFEAVGTCEVGS